MKALNRTNALLAGIAFAMAGMAFGAQAKEVTGIVNGYQCATEGTTCPVDRLDPHLALEEDFVVQEAKGDFVLIPNVPRDVKVRHVLKRVRVTGEMKPEYNSLKVSEFAVYDKDKGSFTTVWSPELVELERRREVEQAIQRETGS